MEIVETSATQIFQGLKINITETGAKHSNGASITTTTHEQYSPKSMC